MLVLVRKYVYKLLITLNFSSEKIINFQENIIFVKIILRHYGIDQLYLCKVPQYSIDWRYRFLCIIASIIYEVAFKIILKRYTSIIHILEIVRRTKPGFQPVSFWYPSDDHLNTYYSRSWYYQLQYHLDNFFPLHHTRLFENHH